MQRKKSEIVTARMMSKAKSVASTRGADANMMLTDYLCICGVGQKIMEEGLDTVLSELKAQGRNRPADHTGEHVRGSRLMAAFTAIRSKKQTAGAMAGVLIYVV